MLKEIHEQPRSLRQTLSGRIDDVEGEVTLDMDEDLLVAYDRAEFIACGTSYHAGMYAR